ncbi:MAG TPA: hypothetical protein DHD79_12520 [Firmicutes bacterium]|jgi:UPF0716 protein FxsA|nr:hypothetical protein [Bacillota bacterium]HAW70713.1 hypothetical protein [Bacillota bacterium]HAZ20876.1 hypothetical protein [Bacillota bacterium]HBE04934.1 hypothetical protein [Bacillota bacterium]HBG44446.1 hypothetical protein [Bacillota bacterium]
MWTVFWILLTLAVFAEIWLTGTVARFLGFWNTVAIIVLKLVLGIRLAFQHGRLTLEKLRAAIQNRQVPGIPVIEGALFVLAPFLIMIPGFLVSALGALLLWDRVRSWMAEKLRKIGIAWFSRRFLR